MFMNKHLKRATFQAQRFIYALLFVQSMISQQNRKYT